jgi:hypothetical protein
MERGAYFEKDEFRCVYFWVMVPVDAILWYEGIKVGAMEKDHN